MTTKTGITDRRQLAADKYIANTVIMPITGYTWHKAMEEAGYAISTIKTHAKGMWDNVLVQDQISTARAKMTKKAETIRDKVARMYEAGYNVAEKQGNPTGMATNVTGLARMNGLLTDNLNTENKVLGITVQVKE